MARTFSELNCDLLKLIVVPILVPMFDMQVHSAIFLSFMQQNLWVHALCYEMLNVYYTLYAMVAQINEITSSF